MLAETDTAGQLEEDVDLEHSSSQEVELVFSHSETQVTIRSLIIGGIAGSVIAVSNIYIGLQIGNLSFLSLVPVSFSFSCLIKQPCALPLALRH